MNAPRKAQPKARSHLPLARKRLYKPDNTEVKAERLFLQTFIGFILSSLFDIMQEVCHGCRINHGSQVRELIENFFCF